MSVDPNPELAFIRLANAEYTALHESIQDQHRRASELDAERDAEMKEQKRALVIQCEADIEDATERLSIIFSLLKVLMRKQKKLKEEIANLEDLLSVQKRAVRTGAVSSFDIARTQRALEEKQRENAQTTEEKVEKTRMQQHVQNRLSALQKQLPLLQFEAMTPAEQKAELKRQADAKSHAAKIATLKKTPKGTIMDKKSPWFGYIKHPYNHCVDCRHCAPCRGRYSGCGKIYCFWRIYGEDQLCPECEGGRSHLPSLILFSIRDIIKFETLKTFNQ